MKRRADWEWKDGEVNGCVLSVLLTYCMKLSRSDGDGDLSKYLPNNVLSCGLQVI